MISRNEQTLFSEVYGDKSQKKKVTQDTAHVASNRDEFNLKKLILTERKALVVSSFLNILTVFTLILVVAGGDHKSYSMDGNKSQINIPSVLIPATSNKERITPIKYGFNTHVHAELDSPNDNMTLDTFKKGVDILASNNLDMIRIDIRAREIAETWTSPTTVRFNDNILVYDEAIKYAKDKGLNIFLVTNVPEFAANYSHSEYKKVTENYYEKLSSRYSDQLGEEDVIQIFNEPNKHSYRDHSEMNLPLDPQYMRELSENIEVASKAIKRENKKVIVTANLSYWVGRNENLKEFGPAFFDEIKGIDAISLNLFPDDKAEEIERLPQYIKFFSDRYKKPVYLAEIGLPTYVFTQIDQGNSLSKSIDVLQKGEVRPKGIIIHELFDVTTSFKEAEKTFGIYYSNGTPKESAYPVISAMMDDEYQN